MASFDSNYFWILDNELPLKMLRGYQSAVADHPDSALSQTLGLIERKVPITPKVYVTSRAQEATRGKLPGAMLGELEFVLGRLEMLSGRRFGAGERRLLLTLKGDLSGAIRSLGCAPDSLRSMIHDFGPARAYTAYIGFLESFSMLALGSPLLDFKELFCIKADREGGSSELESIPEADFVKRVQEYQNLISQKLGNPFPDKPSRQLLIALMRASKTALGAGGDELFLELDLPLHYDSAAVSGIVYTRNPFSGKKELHGTFQPGDSSQKLPLEPDAGATPEQAKNSLRERMPQLYSLIKRSLVEIEASFRDVIEAEFVADPDGHLSFVRFDKPQATARATVAAAVELNREGKISDLEAALRIRPKDVEVLLHATLDESSRAKLKDVGSSGVTAAPGTAIGHVFFTMAEAMEFYQLAVKNKTDKRVILIADELLISDTPGLGIIQGLVTRASGLASHAAVMARANGIPCIIGYKGLELLPEKNAMSVGSNEIKAGTLITLEAGAEGKLYVGEGKLQNLSYQEGVVRDVAQLFDRVEKAEGIPFEIRVNVNNAKDAETGLHFGADGVGLCRTENMFMEAIQDIRAIVFTRDPAKCAENFRNLEEQQFQDFKKIFQVMRGRTVNIRLMDVPLHDFVPQKESDFQELERQLPHLGREHIRAVAEELHEHNPMLGLRACRLGLITPQLYDMQLRAIIRAAYAVAEAGMEVKPGIMFPLVFTDEELSRLRARVEETERVIREELKLPHTSKLHFKVGSMIELPAAALGADRLASIGEFFAFGTNDLTQTTLGMSRDDSAHYLPAYLEKGLLPADPFKVLSDPVRQLVEIAVSRGQRVRADVSFGICGEQGGDPTTLEFCLRRGLNYVSCSPFRVLPTKIALLHVANRLGLVSQAESQARAA